MLLHKGEVWIITGRRGRLTIKLLEDVDPADDIFFDAKLVAGSPHYMSPERAPEVIGDTMTFRASITLFVRPEDD
ncbi:hypothetical protein LCGC14_2572070 [marine sediment metagenome]|uniref:Uncharacterized protein n=1 Tax=marine sediment metagenome TaxID=412755 RepID=A0A0F9B4W1_9ZZZZ